MTSMRELDLIFNMKWHWPAHPRRESLTNASCVDEAYTADSLTFRRCLPLRSRALAVAGRLTFCEKQASARSPACWKHFQTWVMGFRYSI